MILDIFEYIKLWYNRKEDIPLEYKNIEEF
jgi:hypothetical protein